MTKPNRIEVINCSEKGNEQGRIFTFWKDDIEIEIERQDDGRTLKAFIKDKNGGDN